MAGSLLRAVGLEWGIADSLEDYAARAVAFGTDAGLRARLPAPPPGTD
jgi:predicted O-linked N-acetylglucosamine transferase (SPINDLY family)